MQEPDLDSCLTAATWVDQLEIRALAVQQAYADAASRSGQALSLTVIAPPMSAPKYDVGTGPTAFGRIAVDNIHAQFPGSNSPSWWNFKQFSYHQYNTPGYGMRSAYDKMARSVRSGTTRLPLRITEHNCYSASVADQSSQDVMDLPETAACLAGQVIALAGRAPWTSVQKFSQTYSTKGSGVVKNGIMWAELARDGCDIGGSTKSAEAYRLLLQRTPGSNPLYNYTTTPRLSGMSPWTFFTTSSANAYYVYSANTASAPVSVTLAMSKLKGVTAGAPVITSAVTAALNGEVSSVGAVATSKTLAVAVPPQSVLMLTVPRVPLSPLTTLLAVADTTLTAGSGSSSPGPSAASTITVHTSTTDASSTSVALVRFDLGAISPSNIVAAVLQLTTVAVPGTVEVLTVFGTNGAWDQATATWNSVPFLKTTTTGTDSIATNFIEWTAPNAPTIVGHVTPSTAGKTVQLDVTEYLAGGGDPSFMVARLFRFDARGNLPADNPGDPVSFASKEAASGQPALEVWTTA